MLLFYFGGELLLVVAAVGRAVTNRKLLVLLLVIKIKIFWWVNHSQKQANKGGNGFPICKYYAVIFV